MATKRDPRTGLYLPVNSSPQAATVRVRVSGDIRAARNLASTNINRWLQEFHRLTDFQQLKQNRHIIRDASGYVVDMTSHFGADVVNVFVPPPVPRPEEKRQEEFPLRRVCPVVPGLAVQNEDYLGLSTANRDFAGYFVFLDGFFSSNAVFIPHDHDISAETSFSPALWGARAERVGKYNLQGLASITGQEVAYGRVYWNPPTATGFPTEIWYTEIDGAYTALDNSPVSSFTDAANFIHCPRPFGVLGGSSIGAVWDQGNWCSTITLENNYQTGGPNGVGYYEFSYIFKFNVDGATWEKELEPVRVLLRQGGASDWDDIWNGWAYPLTNPVVVDDNFLTPGDDFKNYKDSAGNVYALRGASVIYTETSGQTVSTPPRAQRAVLVSPSYSGNTDVQWLSCESIANLTSAETTIDSTQVTVYPSLFNHDWCIVEEQTT